MAKPIKNARIALSSDSVFNNIKYTIPQEHLLQCMVYLNAVFHAEVE